MPENRPDPSAKDSADYRPTAAELTKARAEVARYPLDAQYSYACGALRFVAEEVVAGRADEFTIVAARYALALAEVARESPSDRQEMA
ncbi:hypothetical protein [Pseudofrankia sp. BMG5.37]|uniref:hypothetical protein n=1 Tax=Pseudofrankia sp. BMG5.37 TaxID=3050035 RepID=UPI0028942ACC|nr:hypothetical protein [Pseudofrankia sp. BMG5.37]MDT3444279.1 hypothetical protein [Pseudofrankia sp. BMG5.37]